MAPPAAVTLCVREEEFLALREEWNDLVARSPRPWLFLTHEWMSAWWRARKGAGGRELYVVLVRESGALTGIAPLVRRRRGAGPASLRALELMTMERYAYSPGNISGSLEFIGAAGGGVRVAETVGEFLLSRRGEWDYLRLHPLPADSETLTGLTALARARGLPFVDRTVYTNAVIELPESWEAYLRQVSPRFRKRLRHTENALRRNALPRVLELGGAGEPPDPAAIVREMEAIDARSWKETGGNSLTGDATRRIVTAQVAAAAARGGIRLWILELDGRRVAYDLGVLCNGSLEILRGSYDRALARLSPGIFLTMEELRSCIAAGVRRVNLLWGDLEYKTRWAGRAEECRELYLAGGTAAGRVFHACWVSTGLYRGARFLVNYPGRRRRPPGPPKQSRGDGDE